MPYTPKGFNSALSLFSSLFTDMNPTDLPEGLSPDNQDVWFLPGSVSTRPALNKLLTTPLNTSGLPTPTVMSLADLPLENGDFVSVILDSNGKLQKNSPGSGQAFLIGNVASGSYFKSENAFTKQWYAFYAQNNSKPFSDNPFVGTDFPRYSDGTSLWRVTQDAPGISPTFQSVNVVPVNIVATAVSGTLTVTSVVTAGEKDIIVRAGRYGDPIDIVTFTKLVYTCSTAVPANWLSSFVTVTGTSSGQTNISGQITAVSGNTFTLNRANANAISLSGQTGTATLQGNYLIRSGNTVTAYIGATKPANFVPGLFVSIQNASGSDMNGGNWTITAISRDSTGLVKVTISTQLTNLTPGTVLYINAVDTADFPVGLQTVYQVLSATGGTTVFTYQSLSTTVVSSTGGSVYQIWSGTFQILSVAQDTNANWFITYFQLGPDLNLNSGSTPQAQLQSQIPAGVRNAVCMFTGPNGAITGPSTPVQVTVAGGPNLLQAIGVPIGPAGTTQRIIALTPVQGSSYYYITPSLIPAIGGLAPLLSLGTILDDNVSTSIILDFSDSQLTSGTQINAPGNNLFNQVVLAPCLGVIEYEGRLGWWGEINNIKNFVNMGFDGGYQVLEGFCNTAGTTVTWVSGAQFPASALGQQIIIYGTGYTITAVASATSLTISANAGINVSAPFQIIAPIGIPLGWFATLPSGYTLSSGGQAQLVSTIFTEGVPGFAYQMTSAGGGTDCAIGQAAYQDYFGGPILQPNKNYIFRLLASALAPTGVSPAGVLRFIFWQPSTLTTLANAIIPISALGTSMTWQAAVFDKQLPAAIPSDTIIQFFLQNVPAGYNITVDELEIIDAAQPVLSHQIRLSYFDNPFGYDDITGAVGINTSESIVAAFKQRGNLYFLTDKSLYHTANNGSTEPNNWNVTQDAAQCGGSSPNAVDVGEDTAFWAGKYGLQLFTGDHPKKISQEVQAIWDSVNWASETAIWLANDPIQRILYIGLPTGVATAPNIVQPVSYRSVDTYNIPDPLHISYSGKLICSDLCRKSTKWNIQANCGALLTRSGNLKQMVFGGGNGMAPGGGAVGFGNIYSLNSAKFTDDDYGVIASYYVTYFHWNHEMEQSVQDLGLHRKLYLYLSAFITGVGNVQITPLVDSLLNPWPALQTRQLVQLLTHDIEWPVNVNGDRVAFKVAVTPLPGQTDAYFNLQHMVIAGKMDSVFPVRGSVL